MLRSRDIPESKSASESDPYSDFEIVCPSRQPRRACLCAIVAAGALSLWGSFAKYNGTRAFDCLVHCAKRSSLFEGTFEWNEVYNLSSLERGLQPEFFEGVSSAFPIQDMKLD